MLIYWFHCCEIDKLKLGSHLKSTMAPPRADNKKSSKERSKQRAAKKDSKSSLPSTALAVAATALIAICVGVYYKNGHKIEKEFDEATKESTGSASNTRNDVNTDFKVLPRLNGVKVSERKPYN